MADQEQKSNQDSAERRPDGQHQQASRGEREPRGESQQQRGRTGPRQLRLQQKGREAYKEAQQLASTLEQAVDEIGQFLREQTERRPYVSLATATGIGYVLGGGVPSRLTALLFGLGSRFAVEMFLRELISDGAGFRSPAPEQNRSAS